MSSEIIDKKEQAAINNTHTGVTQITIPKDWRALIGLKDENGVAARKCTVELRKGKHGCFVAVYNAEFQKK